MSHGVFFVICGHAGGVGQRCFFRSCRRIVRRLSRSGIVGNQRDSHEFAADCAAKGVSALVIQHDIDLSALPGVTVVKVESSRYAMALMSANLFGNPSRQMTMIGVTGTKGKTTTTHMIKSVLETSISAVSQPASRNSRKVFCSS